MLQIRLINGKYSMIILLIFFSLYSNALYKHLNIPLAKSLWAGFKKLHSLSTKLIALNITDLHSSFVIFIPPSVIFQGQIILYTYL